MIIPNPFPGAFIVFDGVDFCGKTTQRELTFDHLSEYLPREKVRGVKEPGKARLWGQRIYEELRTPGGLHTTDPFAFQSWYAIDSRENVKDNVFPDLADGRVVLADRYRTSMVWALPEDGSGFSALFVQQRAIMGEFFLRPDVVFIFDIAIEEALRRKVGKGVTPDEHETGPIIERVGRNFLSWPRWLPRCNFHVIDANPPADIVHASVWNILEPFLRSRNLLP